VTARTAALLVIPALGLGLASCGSENRADQDAFCTELRQSIDQNVTVFDPQDPADPEEATATLDELAALAPEEIGPDVVVLRDVFADLADAIAEIDLQDPAAADTLAGVELDEERIAAAQSSMVAYARNTCRIPLLNGPASATTTTSIPTPTTTTPPSAPTSTPVTEPTPSTVAAG
jgi:hypothetical protein